MKSVKGFTLIELMIVVVLLAIAAAIAVPNFINLIHNNQLQGKADELNNLLQYARSEAVSTRSSVNVQASSADSKWVVVIDGNVTRMLEYNSDQMDINSSIVTLTFNSNGTAGNAAKIGVCRDGDKANGYLLEVMRSGATFIYPRGKQDTKGADLASCSPS
ncbi:GspH/FimT family protein [Halopseudomonas pelagia]|uniref:GspH/FimT family pseudopilin n=1 Tax=Halopseudomonas pelagia TaxID=553151 RepID=UPI0030DAB854|tara:strand:+ start:561 stop:1043 length:483 start_codon:yes stop_codon:yes gene_type:complete